MGPSKSEKTKNFLSYQYIFNLFRLIIIYCIFYKPKTQQQVVAQARQELAAGKKPDTALMKDIHIRAEQQVLALKKQMENQVRQEQILPQQVARRLER